MGRLCATWPSGVAPNPFFLLSSRATSLPSVTCPRIGRRLRRVRLFLLGPRAAELPTLGWGRKEGLTGRGPARGVGGGSGRPPRRAQQFVFGFCVLRARLRVRRSWSLAAKARPGPDTQVCGRH